MAVEGLPYNPIIGSLLDTDLYKFTMGQVVLHQFADFNVKYKFKCRNPGIVFTDKMVEMIKEQVKMFCMLRLDTQEVAYLKTIRFLKSSFVEFLKMYQPNMEHFKMDHLPDGSLDITIEGPWFSTIYWEVPLLAIINEVYMSQTYKIGYAALDEAQKRLMHKVRLAKVGGIRFSDFGTRRRFSHDIQDVVVKVLSEYCKDNFTGTSNVELAMKYGVTAIGTMAHEFICAGQACEDVTLAGSQKYMLQQWVNEYRGDLGIALSDTLGTNKFLKDFDPYFAKLYDGIRHDSGSPFEWAEKMITHYQQCRIDPKTKTLVFSDGLTFPLAVELQKAFGDRIKVAFGIGTNLTNDFAGIDPLQIVIKMVEANGRPVAKLSDNPAKTMCEDEGFIKYLRSVI